MLRAPPRTCLPAGKRLISVRSVSLHRLYAALLALLLQFVPVALHAGDKSAELMAAYVFNFARFVEWPAAQLPQPQTPLAVCSPDPEALDGHLLRIHGRVAQSHTVIVKIVSLDEGLAGCHVVFLPATAGPRINDWLAMAAGKPLLTVSDAPEFIERGGMIRLFVEADRVQFGIDRAQTLAAGLRVSSRLLALARRPPRGTP